MIGWWLLAGCPRPLPDHLRLDRPPPPLGAQEGPAEVVVDRASALAATLGADPLARTLRGPDPAALAGIAGTAPLVAFLTERRSAETAREPAAAVIAGLEAAHPGTEVVGLARGYGLTLAENHLRNTLVEPRVAQRDALAAATPLRLGPDDPANARLPLEWAGGPAGFLALTERRVLAGWLAGPDVPLAPVAKALAASPFDALRARPLGQLVAARGAGNRADGDAAFDDLRRATHLSLVRVAADRDNEQGAWADEKRRVAQELGVTDPVRALLERAFVGLLADAGDPRSAGGALVAATALRILDRCADAPCGGVDRSETLHAARAWHPDVGALAQVWDIVFWDQTLATMEAGRETGLFSTAVVDLADLLVGTGNPVDGAILAKLRPDATVWLAAGRAVGSDGEIDWPGAHVALGRHLQVHAREAATGASEEDRALLERIASRAVP